MSEDTARLSRAGETSLAEISGVDGSFVFPERLLQQLWLRGEFSQEGLRLRDGRKVRLIKRGRWNRLPGPDFIDAEFRVESDGRAEVVRGDVEVHLRAQDWEHHGHARDPGYDKVVLHVILFPAADVTTRGAGGRAIPILELLPLLEQDLESYAQEAAVERLAGRTYSELRMALTTMSPASLTAEVERQAGRRWAAKLALARRQLEIFGWEDSCHRRALEVLGYRPNREPMLAVAEAWPLSAWRNGTVTLAEIWSSQADSWMRSGVRPANSPRNRLAQYGRWVSVRTDWPFKLEKAGPGLERAGLLVSAAAQAAGLRARRREASLAGWRRRLSDEVTGDVLGGTRFDTMVCDAWLPLLAARGVGEAEVAGLEGCWRDWWPGDAPSELVKLGRDFLAEGAIGQGTVQGLLGWLSVLRDQEGRGT